MQVCIPLKTTYTIVMEDIRNPPRLDSLNPTTIQIIQHTGFQAKTTFLCEDVYPFETLFNIKQRITLSQSKEEAKYWLPSQVFLAEERDGKFLPLEFEWGFRTMVQDPYDPAYVGKPFRELFQNGERVPATPTLFSGILLETVTKAKTLHIWNIAGVAKATGFRPSEDIPDEILFGYLHLYFPMIGTKAEFAHIDKPVDPEVLEIVETHRGYVQERYHKLETIVKDTPASPIQLTELLDLHYRLPKKAGFKSGFLEMRFYEMEPTESVPFLRFFPSNIREMPIVKLSSKKGFSAIENKRLLNKLLDDQPSNKLGAVILIKAPVRHPEAPLGTTWTIRIFEDGNAELVIGAPRKNQPLLTPVLAEANKLLPTLLAFVPWLDTKDLQLSQISAVYKYKSPIDEKPSKEEIKLRLDPFLPMFFLEKGLDPTAQASLRYKAVSNYVKDTDPIMDYITNLYLRDSATSVDPKVFQSYIIELVKEFGISKQEASRDLDAWVTNHSEQMVVGTKIVLERNMGSAISLYNEHPNYRFVLTGVESIVDLKRILTLLTILVSHTHETLQIAESKQERKDVEETIEEVEKEVSQVVEESQDGEEWSFAMASRLPHANNDEEDEEEEEEEEIKEVQKQIQEEKPQTIFKDTLPALSKEWYLNNLKEKNTSLFSTDSHKPYSRICQASSGKQPNVMDFATYQRAKLFYKNDVFWITSPLSPHAAYLLQFASKTVSERMKRDSTEVLPKDKQQRDAQEALRHKEMIQSEKDALRLGFPLKKGESVTEKIKDVSQEDVQEIKALIKEQETKPLWTVVRAGSEKANYYICAEYWCIRDNLPILPNEFEGTISRRRDENGQPLTKQPNSCPVCGGTVIETFSEPKQGETIVKRIKPSSSKIQKYAGFLKILHPSGHALPCCFADPDSQTLPDDAKQPPFETEEEAKEKPKELPSIQVKEKERENRNRPFSKLKKDKTSQNDWYIPNQNILGRIVDRWLILDKGSVATPSKAVNNFLGQDSDKFLTKKGGVSQGSVNSHLTVPGHAFLQYGLGNSLRYLGNNLLSFLAYIRYATKYSMLPDDSLAIESNESVLARLFEENWISMFHAFQSANYGTLVHEFRSTSTVQTVERKRDNQKRKPVSFSEFFAAVSFAPKELDAGQRAFFEYLFLAWDNFEDYVRDKEASKDLRLWEGLFTVKGLIAEKGCILVKVIVPKDPSSEARIECPTFGISLSNQKEKLPLLFVLQDSITGLYDPLVFYEGKKDVKILLGVISEAMPVFGTLSSTIREPIKAFMTEYFRQDGCGRITEPVHPWLLSPIDTLQPVPKFSDYVHMLDTQNKDYDLYSELVALARDRSHRLIGVLIYYKPTASGPFFLPCVDDGWVDPTLPSIYGEDSLPRPNLNDYLDFLTGRNKMGAKKEKGKDWSKHKWASHFKALEFRNLVKKDDVYVAVDLACGITVPIKPVTTVNMEEIFGTKRTEKRFQEGATIAKEISEFPWFTDTKTLEDSDALPPGSTDEEILEESYQHLRITISNWLNEDVRGRKVRSQIEALRQARKRLPLYELQKRLEIVLMPEVQKYITTEGLSTSSLLRKDCSKTAQKDCTGGCVWVGDACLIHATRTERYRDPLYVLTARLVDELLRSFGSAMEILNQHVSHLKPFAKDQVQKDGDVMLFSAFGKGDEALFDALGYSRRRPGKYTQALTYPEEVSLEDITLPKQADTAFAIPRFGADVRTEYERLIASLVQMTDLSFAEIEAIVGKFRNTEENWAALGKHLHANIVLVGKRKVLPFESTMYILLNAAMQPLKHRSGKYIVQHEELPNDVKAWLPTIRKAVEAANPMNGYETVEAIDLQIAELYGGKMGDEESNTRATGQTLADVNFPYVEYSMIFSSSNKFDCFIHSFLTTVSQNFRRLPQDLKDAFASMFRRTIYPEILQSLSIEDRLLEEFLQRAKGQVFLNDADISKLCEFYKRNILMFEGEKTERIKDLSGGKLVKMPACVTFHDWGEDKDCHMIYNADGSHFEALRSAKGYTIQKTKALEIFQALQCDKGSTKIQCKYKEGDTVQYKGKPHYVIWRLSNEDGACKKYGLTDSSDGLSEFLQLPQVERDKKEILLKFGSIEVEAEEIESTV